MASNGEGVGMQKLLELYFLGTVQLPVSRMVLTTCGRPLREHGVAKLKAAILEHGFMENFAPLVTLMFPLKDSEDFELVLSDGEAVVKVIDGNHRVAAQAAIDRGTGVDTLITVRVHSLMAPSTERMVARALNNISSTIVEKVLVDDVLWYRDVIKSIEGGNARVQLSQSQIAKKVQQEFIDEMQIPPARGMLLKFTKMAQSFTDLALSAMMDVTYLNGRRKFHPDRKLFDHKRVTRKMLYRDEFHKMDENEQEVYIYRLAKGFAKHQILSEEECSSLDKEACIVGREVGKVVKIAPRSQWSPAFMIYMKRVIVKDLSAGFELHHEALIKNVERYVAGLHAGMEACEKHKEMLLAKPHYRTAQALARNPAMLEFWAPYCERRDAMEKKASRDAVAFLQGAATRAAEATAMAPAKAVKVALENATTLCSKAPEAGAASSPACAVASPEDDPKTSSSSSSAEAPTTKVSITTPFSAGGQPAEENSKDSAENAVDVAPKGTAGAKRKSAPPVKWPSIKRAANDKGIANLRKEVTTVQTVDVLSSSWDVATDPLQVDDDSMMLIFFNVGVDPSILLSAPDSTARLDRVLVNLAAALHPRGTMAIAMESTAYNFFYMDDRLKAMGLILEKNPPISVYLEGQAGRIPDHRKNHYTRQSSSVLIAHKNGDFAQHGAPRDSFSRPREQALEDVGVVVSAKHPHSATFLSRSMAEHLIHRFTLPGDSVMVTAFEDNSIAHLVLGSGRKLCALVADPTKRDKAEECVDGSCTTAMRRGWFADLREANVVVDKSTLPPSGLSSNTSAAVDDEHSGRRAGSDDEGEEGGSSANLDTIH